MDNILQNIIKQKQKDIKELGFASGSKIPVKRNNKITKFLAKSEVILEIKRKSPSKGDIAPNLNPVSLATTYAKAGAKAISVLSEKNFFNGSLEDLINVANEIKTKFEDVAILRKDFILYKEEIEISYLCGADAILLIARILKIEELINLTIECIKFNIMPFIEIKDETCIEKFKKVTNEIKNSNIKPLAGINSRDLANFSIDVLRPSIYKMAMDKNTKIVFESGIQTKQAAEFIAKRGFYGILVGESVAKNPTLAKQIVSNFKNGIKNDKKSKNALFWGNISLTIYKKRINNDTKPLVKICGITNTDDAIYAANAGADMLGFVFCKTSPRNVNIKIIENIKLNLNQKCKKVPILVGVITNKDSIEGKIAIKLQQMGLIDAIQYHGCKIPSPVNDLAHYGAVRLRNKNSLKIINDILSIGQPRILLDSFNLENLGGSGIRIDNDLILKASKLMPLWIAGGINPTNVKEIIKNFKVELIDLSSGVEESLGKKDFNKIDELFKNLSL